MTPPFHQRAFVTSLSIVLMVGSSQAADAPTAAVQWQPMYEPGCGGAIVSVAVSPHDPKLLISGGDMLGIATSFDGGDSWRSTFGLATYEMATPTFHPTDPNVVWIGSCSGPYVSTDRGIHWTQKRAGMPQVSDSRYTAMVEKVLFDPDQPGRLLTIGGSVRRWGTAAETQGWIWESTDNGESWRHVGTIATDGFSTDAKKGANLFWAEYAPGSGSTIHLLAEDAGWYTSDDDGRTWRKHAASGLPTLPTQITFNPKDASVVYAATASYKTGDGDETRQPGGIFKSTDGGRSFSPSSAGIKTVLTADNGNLTSNFANVAVSAANPNVLWTNDGAWNSAVIYKSDDAGASWRPVATRAGLGVEHQQGGSQAVAHPETATFAGIAGRITADPSSADRAYLYNTEFILRTVDGGRTFDDATALRPDASKKDHWRGRGWVGWCSTNIAFNPYRKDQSIAQAMDAARGWISDDGLQSWRFAATDKTHPWLGGVEAAFAKDGTIWLTTGQHGSSNGLLRSRDWGQTWDVLAGAARGLPDTGWHGNAPYDGVYAHPDDSKRAWVALDGRIVRTTDLGETWSPVTEEIGASHIAGDPTTPGRFYVAAKAGVLVTDDGETFRAIGGPGPAGRGRINCDAKGRVIACQWRDGRSGVWRYDPADQAWTRLLDEAQAFECVADPSDPTRLLLATNMDPYNDLAGGNGVWVSNDDGKSWASQNDGLAMRRGLAAAFNPFDPEQIVVGTFGRGFFVGRWSKGATLAATRSYSATAEDATAVATAKPAAAAVPAADSPHVLRDFGPSGFEYAFGDGWQKEGAIATSGEGVTIDATEHGGGGVVLGGVDIAPAGQSKLSMTAKRLPGNEAGTLHVKISAKDGSSSVSFDLSQLKEDAFTTISVDLPADAKTSNVDQLQMQGTNFSAAAKPLKIVIDRIATTGSGRSASAAGNAGDEMTYVIRDLGGLDYTYGETWKNGENVTAGKDGDTTYLQIDATEHGGGGMVLNGADIVPAGQTLLALRARPMPGNEAGSLNANLIGSDQSVSFDLSQLKQGEWATITVPLPGKPEQYRNLQQVQFQGANFSSGAKALKVQIDQVGTTSNDPAANAAAKAAVKASPTAGAPAKDKPNVAAWGYWPDFPQAWMAMFKGQLQEASKGEAQVAFLGDSITQGWGDTGKAIWGQQFAPMKAANFGTGGDTTRQVLWKIENGLLDPIKPKVVVMNIGTNNLYGDQNAGSDEEVAEGIKACVTAIRAKLPDAKVLLLGILPRQNEYFSSRVRNINAITAKLDDGTTVRYLDMGPQFAESLGKVRPELYNADQLHLVEAGYAMWAQTMRPLLDEMMR